MTEEKLLAAPSPPRLDCLLLVRNVKKPWKTAPCFPTFAIVFDLNINVYTYLSIGLSFAHLTEKALRASGLL